jgi:tetratricopeptide (TPR) repeat protein
MATCEAMLRVLVNKAGQGNGPALSEMLRLLATTGRTTEITDEEREKRSMRLPRPLTREEMDLKMSPARERDRQRYLAMAEINEAASERSEDATIPRDVRDGDDLVLEAAFNDALASFNLEIARCKAQLDADKTNEQAQCDYRRGVSRVGLLASQLLEAGKFQQARDFADVALAEAASAFWITPKTVLGIDATNIIWIGVVRAHALMFLGHLDEARRFYLAFRSNKRVIFTSWETRQGIP